MSRLPHSTPAKLESFRFPKSRRHCLSAFRQPFGSAKRGELLTGMRRMARAPRVQVAVGQNESPPGVGPQVLVPMFPFASCCFFLVHTFYPYPSVSRSCEDNLPLKTCANDSARKLGMQRGFHHFFLALGQHQQDPILG